MSTPFAKAALKKARDAIQAKNWQEAVDQSKNVLEYEADNYNARVFLGLALLNLGKYSESEAAYKQAIKSNPSQLLAWQGIANFYEKQQQWTSYAETQRTMAQIHYDAKDAFKCAEAIRKLLDCQRENGSRQDVIEALSLLLPSSPFFDLLSTLPEPEPTAPTGSSIYEVQQLVHDSLPILVEIVTATEAAEFKQIKDEIDKRKMRLNSGSAAETRAVVQREVMSGSKLPELYRQLLNHASAGDDLRRETESKLLHHLKTQLFALPDPFEVPEMALTEVQREERAKQQKRAGKAKDVLRGQVQEIAKGMTLLRLPDELAWRVVLDWLDVSSAESYPLSSLLDVCWHVRSLPMTQVLQGHLLLAGRTDVLAEEEMDDEESTKPSEEDMKERAFDLIRNGLEADPSGLTSHVLATLRYSEISDHETVIDLAEAGLALSSELAGLIGRRFTRTQRCLEAALAVALTHYNAPSHHRRALRLLDPILKEQPDNIDCVLARGYIMIASERWQDALTCFDRVLALTAVEDVRIEAQSERAWALVPLGQHDDAQRELKAVLTTLEAKGPEARGERARVWWRLGTCYWETGGELKNHPDHAYTAFVNAIKASPVFAPAFTSLGRFYLEVSSPPDHARASKCFQKAFELDPREDVAARLLAEEFANDGQWDLVEVLARRVIAGAAIQGSEERAVAGSALARKHAWAWRAIGSAELNTQRYTEAVHAFQSALRGAPSDVNAWLQLGLAYRGAGQYMAALKTFNKVLTLDQDNWYAFFCAGDIQRTMGLLDAAIKTFTSLVEQRKDASGVPGVLAETYLLRARSHLRSGSRIKAEADLDAALRIATGLIEAEQGTRVAWKVIADCYVELGGLEELTQPDVMPAHIDTFDSQEVDSKVGETLEASPSIADVRAALAAGLPCFLLMAVVAYKMRLLLELYEDGAGAAWYDVALSMHRAREELLAVRAEQSSADLQRASVHCLRQALRHEPRNPIYWTALGAVSLDLSARLSQHAFIKAAEINPRSAVAWTHLGLFYIQHEDYSLANEAFLRSQTLDPEFAPAWLGQAALAALNGDQPNADMLIEHAWLLGGPLAVSLAYGTRSASHARAARTADALFSLTKYLAKRPRSNATALHAHGMLCEQVGLLDTAAESLSAAVASLETEYERSEDVTIERRYAIANNNLARVLLAQGDHAGSIAAADAALGLFGDEEAAQTARGRALLVKGLSQILSEDADGLQTLEQATECEGSKSALVLAQALWQKGDESSREAAKQHLLARITDPTSGLPNLPAVASLGAAAILTGDDDLLDAAVSEVANVSADQKASLDPLCDVDELLIAHALLKDDVDASLSIRAKSVAARPASGAARRQLATLLLRDGKKDQAQRLLLPDDRHSDSLRAVLTGGIDEAQRAIKQAPWEASAWQALACAA